MHAFVYVVVAAGRRDVMAVFTSKRELRKFLMIQERPVSVWRHRDGFDGPATLMKTEDITS